LYASYAYRFFAQKYIKKMSYNIRIHKNSHCAAVASCGETLYRIVKPITLLLLLTVESPAQSVQHIRGTVSDEASGEPLAGVNVLLLETSPAIGTVTDSAGCFLLKDIPVGRYDMQVSCIGYETALVREILLGTSREVMLEIALRENIELLNEVVVTPRVNKSQPLNRMITVSGRMLSVEEGSRYAGGFDDPARLASSYAGVTGSVGNNGIVVRGNAPKFLQWRLEDVEIPNPNHFAEMTSFGGGGLTALSNQVLGNSDFLTGAFPAEYGNAVSGVFDINLRNGNNGEHEQTVQVGLIGIDIASEGPLSRGGQASYIFNYRYSTLSLLSPLLPEDADGTQYQDLSFKCHFPNRKAGTFSVWGTGLVDRSGAVAETDRERWIYLQDRESMDVKQFMAAAGVKHKINAGGVSLKTVLAATVSGLDMHTERMNDAAELVPRNVIGNTNWNFVFSSALNRKFSARHTNRTGIRITGLKYGMLLKKNAVIPGNPLHVITDESDFSALFAAYTNSAFHFSDRWTVNAGVHSQWLALNNRYTVEPRLGIKWKFLPGHSFSFAYGLHSRMEMLHYYFTRDEKGERINKNLDFTRSRHWILSYDRNIGTDCQLKVETYLQHLFRVPVIPGSTFSFINLKGNDDWFITDRLVNQGCGLNYGIEATFEKYMSQGYYFMLTGSLFNARYKTGGKQWFNTRYNRNFAFNLLGGKEWMLGKSRQNVLGMNGRITYQGGDRYSPVDEKASALQEDAVYDETRPYSRQLPAALIGHLTLSYKINKGNRFHEFAIKILNITGYRDYYGHRYNFKTGKVDEEREAVMIPNISYRIEF
jgi:hypothetical protein